MFDSKNPYNIRIETIDGIDRYFVSFKDGQAAVQETEVSYSVFLELCRFIRRERNLTRSDERHIEQYELSDEILHQRVLKPPRTVEKTVISNDMANTLHAAIAALPEIQRRRFILHYEIGLTYEQIANTEGCSKVAVKYSIDIAKEKILKKFKKQT